MKSLSPAEFADWLAFFKIQDKERRKASKQGSNKPPGFPRPPRAKRR